MKRMLAVFLAALTLAALAACKSKDAPAEPTAEPTALPPGVTQDPYPTQDPARAAFDPDTDFDNRRNRQIDSIIETDELYYLDSHICGFLCWSDKATGDYGVVCPRPECMHEESLTRDDLKKCVGNIQDLYMTIYEGKLYWFANVYEYRSWCLMRMDLDGSNKELVRKVALPEGRDQPQMVCFHRGSIYMELKSRTVVNGSPTNYLSIAVVPMFEEGFKELFFRYSYITPQVGFNFIGDDFYVLASFDNADESLFGGDPEENPEGYAALEPETVILRWNPLMDEPEILLDEMSGGYGNASVFWAEPDGTVYFMREHPLYPELESGDEGYKLNQFLCRRDPEGAVTELFDMQYEGETYYMDRISGGLLFCHNGLSKKTEDFRIMILDLDRNVIYKGPLPMAYRERTPPGSRFTAFTSLVLYPDHFITCMLEYAENDEVHPARCYFVRYDITEDGLVETFLAESAIAIRRE